MVLLLEIAGGVFIGGVLLKHWELVLGILWVAFLAALGLLLMAGSIAYRYGGF